MKHIFTSLLFFLAFNCFSQFSHTPNPAVIEAPIDSLITKYYIDIIMEKDTTYEVHWQLFKDGETWKDGWGTQVCDLNLCYLENIDRNPRNIPNTMGKGIHTFSIYFLPNGIPGDTQLELVLYGDAEHINELYRIPVDVHAINTSNTFNINSQNEITVYPNPAQDYFSIINSSKVDKIKLYNILGNEVKTFYHYNNAQHIIAELKAGMYILRMLDKDNKTIKTIKLNKLFSGA